jgi:hypothetical protein
VHRSGLTARCVPVLAVPPLAGAAAACSSAAVARAPAESPDLGASFSIHGGLYGATATSTRSTRAVGYAGSVCHTSKTLIVRWNGSARKRVPSPSPPSRGRASLTAVTATSADNAWAFGCAGNGNCVSAHTKTLIERWHGNQWKRVPSPTPARAGYLQGVTASTRSAWAVGQVADIPGGPEWRDLAEQKDIKGVR